MKILQDVSDVSALTMKIMDVINAHGLSGGSSGTEWDMDFQTSILQTTVNIFELWITKKTVQKIEKYIPLFRGKLEKKNDILPRS